MTVCEVPANTKFAPGGRDSRRAGNPPRSFQDTCSLRLMFPSKPVACIALALLAGLPAGCVAQTHLTGTWRNLTQVHQMAPGDLTVALHPDGTGRIFFDEKKYYWFFHSFRYRVEGDEILVTPDEDSHAGAKEVQKKMYKKSSIEAFKTPIVFRISGKKLILDFHEKEYVFEKASNY